MTAESFSHPQSVATVQIAFFVGATIGISAGIAIGLLNAGWWVLGVHVALCILGAWGLPKLLPSVQYVADVYSALELDGGEHGD